MLKIGVVGVGHLGKIHLKCLQQISGFEIVGFFDVDEEACRSVAAEFKVRRFDSAEELIENIDVLDIVTPTHSHFLYASSAIRKFKHVFIEKPIVSTPEEARVLLNLAQEANVKVQVGHVERFNPAFLAAKKSISNPMFIESHRLAVYNPRGTEVSVVLDLMIHDIDVILSVVKSRIKKIHANGVAVISDSADIANARIEFENGAVANLTASRVSFSNMRKIRFFQQDAYISVDFLHKKAEIARISNLPEGAEAEKGVDFILESPNQQPKRISVEHPEVVANNAIMSELELFYESIMHDVIPVVTINDGADALDVAIQIANKIYSK